MIDVNKQDNSNQYDVKTIYLVTFFVQRQVEQILQHYKNIQASGYVAKKQANLCLYDVLLGVGKIDQNHDLDCCYPVHIMHFYRWFKIHCYFFLSLVFFNKLGDFQNSQKNARKKVENSGALNKIFLS